MSHKEFVDLSGDDPRRPFAEALVADCGEEFPIFVYNIAFERTRVRELVAIFPDLERDLVGIAGRLVDLLPIVKQHYYHPSQKGSWSIKYVLPALVPELSYDDLEGIQNGGMIQGEFERALDPKTTAEEKSQIEESMLRYCELDTLAMVRIWEALSS